MKQARDRVSQSMLSGPGRYWISNRYSDSSKRHRIILSFFIFEECFILNIKATAYWSVTMVNFLPIRNSLHLRTASMMEQASLPTPG